MTLPDPDGAGSQPAPVSTFAYDAAGRLIATARADAQASPPLEQTLYAYDGLGRLVAQTDFRGTLTSTYDAAGRLTATTDRLGRVTSYAYDALDRPTRVTAPDPDGNPATGNTPVWAFAYDAAGQQRLAIDPAGARTATAYDDAGAVALVRDPVGSATRFARDAVGNLTGVTDPLGNTTTTTFDALDRPVREQVGFTAADRTFAYDPAGNLDRVKDRNGRVIDFDADNLGRTVAEKWLPVGGTTPIRTLTSTYTATGQLQGIVDSDVVDSSFTYDALDRPVTETTGLHGSVAPSTPFTFTLTSTYDAADRRTGLADSRGGQATYGYDCRASSSFTPGCVPTTS